MRDSTRLLARLRAKFPGCDYATLATTCGGDFVSMEARGTIKHSIFQDWYIIVSPKDSYAVVPPDIAFELKYGYVNGLSWYTQEVRGSIEDAEARMRNIIDDMHPTPARPLHSITIALLCCAMICFCLRQKASCDV